MFATVMARQHAAVFHLPGKFARGLANTLLTRLRLKNKQNNQTNNYKQRKKLIIAH